MMMRLVIPAMLLLTPASVVGADIPRNGELGIPSSEEMARVCGENPDVNTDKRIAYCVLSELDGAEGVMAMIANNREAASEAYWDCADRPEINSFALLNACMEQELELNPAHTTVIDDGGSRMNVKDEGNTNALEKDQSTNQLEKEN